MKKLVLIILTAIAVHTLKAQEETKKPPFFIRPFVETGITFLKNDNLKEVYKTNSMYNIGGGLRFGIPGQSKILPFIHYSYSEFATRATFNDIQADSVLKLTELILGAQLVLKPFDSGALKTKVAYIFPSITDDINSNNGKGNGLQIGIGYEINILRNSRIFIDYSYNFMKFRMADYRDYDNQKVTIGFIL